MVDKYKIKYVISIGDQQCKKNHACLLCVPAG